MLTRLYAVLTIGNLLDAIVLSFLPLYGAHIGLGPNQLGVLSAASLVAWCLSPTVGVWIDSGGPFRTLRLSVLLRAVLLAGACVFTVLVGGSGPALGLWLVLALGTGITDMVSDLSTQTAASQLVPGEKVTHVYGRIAAIQSLTAAVLAPVIAGVLVGWPLGRSFLVMAVLAAVALLMPIRPNQHTPTQHTHAAKGESFLTNVGKGFQVVTRDSWLRRSAITVGTLNLGSSAVGTAFLVYMIQDHDTDPAHLGTMLGLSAVAVPFGGVVAGRLGVRLGFSRSVMVGLLALVVSMGAPITGPNLWVLGALYLTTGLFTPLMGVSMISHRQQAVDPAVIGRVNGVFQFIGIGIAPAGALLGGVLTGWVGSYPVFVGVVGLCLAVALMCRPWQTTT